MRTTALIILISLSIVLIIGCSSPKPINTEVSVMSDVTDTQNTQPNANEILNLYNLTDSQWNGGVLNYSTLTDVGYNQSKQTAIKPENEWLSNELERNKEIKNFKNEIQEILSNSNEDGTGKPSSSIYFPIAKELIKLSASKSERRILIVYSDLMENTTELSFYKPKDFEHLKTQADSLNEYFENELEIHSLNGIEIYLIYQPLNSLGDAQFRVVSEFYKKLFEAKGATVTISANLNL